MCSEYSEERMDIMKKNDMLDNTDRKNGFRVSTNDDLEDYSPKNTLRIASDFDR